MKIAFESDGASLSPMLAELDSPIHLLHLNDELTWRDGAVIRLYSSETARELSERLSDHLKELDMLSIHDAWGDHSEPFGGLLGMYFNEVRTFGAE